MSGSGDFTASFPARNNASHGPTPAAATRTKISPSPGIGRGISSMVITSGGPNLWILAALIIVLPSSLPRSRPSATNYRESYVRFGTLLNSPFNPSAIVGCVRAALLQAGDVAAFARYLEEKTGLRWGGDLRCIHPLGGEAQPSRSDRSERLHHRRNASPRKHGNRHGSLTADDADERR